MNDFFDEQQALDDERHAFERRQAAFIALLTQATPQGSGVIGDLALREWEIADTEWQKSTAKVQQIVDEIKSGMRP